MSMNVYLDDRKKSDKCFYETHQPEILKHIEKSNIFLDNPVIPYKPASDEDDIKNVTDTYINKRPFQLRAQFTETAKISADKMHPTLRFERPNNATEIIKLTQMYNKGETLPYLLWVLADIKNVSIKKLIIVDMQKLYDDKNEKNYKFKDKFTVKGNKDDSSSFIILDDSKFYIYSYIADN